MAARQFEWLEKEISEVKTRRFFDFDGPASGDLKSAIENSNLPLPDSYKAFVLQFGNAKLYKQHAGYAIGVRAGPVEAVSRKKAEPLMIFGHFRDHHAYFKVDLLECGEESPVFEGYPQAEIRKIADGFLDWLKMRSAAARKAIGVKRWAEIVRGPSPFTDGERAIVEARRACSWRLIGMDDDGDCLFEVHNGARIALPFLSIGIRDKRGGFLGRAWLPVSGIGPGETAVIKKDCYKKYVERADLDAYALPEPEPEDRDSYWEFKTGP
jgi:hypothetical protein